MLVEKVKLEMDFINASVGKSCFIASESNLCSEFTCICQKKLKLPDHAWCSKQFLILPLPHLCLNFYCLGIVHSSPKESVIIYFCDWSFRIWSDVGSWSRINHFYFFWRRVYANYRNAFHSLGDLQYQRLQTWHKISDTKPKILPLFPTWLPKRVSRKF